MLNKVMLMGRITADPELKRTPNNTAVCSFSLAVNRRFNKDKTDFINIVTWEKTAEFISKYFTKGQQMVICGALQTRSWEDKHGEKRIAVEVVADEVHFTGSKQDNGGNTNEPTFSEIEEEDGDLPF